MFIWIWTEETLQTQVYSKSVYPDSRRTLTKHWAYVVRPTFSIHVRTSFCGLYGQCCHMASTRTISHTDMYNTLSPRFPCTLSNSTVLELITAHMCHICVPFCYFIGVGAGAMGVPLPQHWYWQICMWWLSTNCSQMKFCQMYASLS